MKTLLLQSRVFLLTKTHIIRNNNYKINSNNSNTLSITNSISKKVVETRNFLKAITAQS